MRLILSFGKAFRSLATPSSVTWLLDTMIIGAVSWRSFAREPKTNMDNIPRLFAPPPALYSSRREFFTRVGGGFGMIALAGLLQQEKLLADPPGPPLARGGEGGWSPPDPTRPMAPRAGHHPAKAKNVIWLFINGGPS